MRIKMEKRWKFIWGIVIFVMMALLTYQGWSVGFNDGYEYGYSDAQESSFELGINWAVNWTRDNCIDYVCNNFNEYNCVDELDLVITEEYCYEIIGGENGFSQR